MDNQWVVNLTDSRKSLSESEALCIITLLCQAGFLLCLCMREPLISFIRIFKKRLQKTGLRTIHYDWLARILYAAP